MAIKRVLSHGKPVWRARVNYQGRRRVSYHASKDAARQAEQAFYLEVRQEAQTATQDAGAPATLRLLLEQYVIRLADHGKPPETVRRARQTVRVLGKVAPDLLDRPVSTIGDADLLTFVRAREREGRLPTWDGGPPRRGIKPSTVQRDVITIRAALKLVRPEFKAPTGALAKADDTRVRWLRPEEEVLVFASMPPPHREIARLAALTLMRLSEIRMLRREQVHLAQGIILLPTTKTEPRAVVMSEAAQAILRAQLLQHSSEWVFPNPNGQPYSRTRIGRAFRKAARAVGLQDFHFHDLRHHGATMALNRGFSAPIVMALGGWKSEATMRRYAAVTDTTLRAAAEAVSGAGPSHLVPQTGATPPTAGAFTGDN